MSTELIHARHATSAMLGPVIEPGDISIVDEYLKHYIDPEDAPGHGQCPSCGMGGFTWGIQWGAGYCFRCDWPGRLYHVIGDPREDDSLVCSATCNGFRVCTATRGEHVPKDIHWRAVDGGESRVEVELQCPDPTPPPGIRSPFTSRWKTPEIVRFNLLLWVHPDYVKSRD